MQLGDLIPDEALDVYVASLEINHVEIDSRRCVFPSLFFALRGTHDDGARYVANAIDHGAVAVVASHRVNAPVPVILVPEERIHATLAAAAAALHGHPEKSMDLVGVTGTNGKTTVVSLVSALARQVGWDAEAIGTLTGERTTPSTPELYERLEDAATRFSPERRWITSLEVSSHALDQRRIAGTYFAVVAFTNLSHDHLDYHGTMEAYFAAKARLFTTEYADRAVVWADDPYGQRLMEIATIPVTSVSRRDADDVSTSLTGTTFFWRGHLVNTRLIGDYNIDNALVAMTLVAELGAEPAAVAAAMAGVDPVVGRFEVVHHGDFSVIVDYAHTPQGLERLLSSVRPMTSGRVIVVFGCGGERDRGKRPEMGRVATSFADLSVVTSDNPRGEDPDAIINAVMSGIAPHAHVEREVDRRRAIELAIGAAHEGDVVVVAGKGHETTQTFADRVVDFDDRSVVREIIKGTQC